MRAGRRPIAWGLLAGLLGTGLAVAGDRPADGSREEAPAIRDGYESPRRVWQREYTDAAIQLLSHERTDRAAHGGAASERFRFEAGPGSRFFVSQAVPKVPVTRDLSISLYVRANRSGAQLYAWVVLPADLDPQTRAPSFVLVPGTVFDRPDRWERLELTDLLPAIEEQARVLRASTRRPVSLEGAYVERVVVNLLSGEGETDVFLDDLRIGPVSKEIAAAWASGRNSAIGAEASTAVGRTRKAASRKDQGEASLPPVQMNRGILERLVPGENRYAPWFPTAIEAPGADLATLRRYGFDVAVTGPEPDLKRVTPLVEGDKPMYLIPRLSNAGEEGGKQRILREISEYPLMRSVLMWSIGEDLGHARRLEDRQRENERVREVLAAIDETPDIPTLATATVSGEFRLYSRAPTNLDVIGLDLPFWGTGTSFGEGLGYIRQRRDILAARSLEPLFWGWLPATTPPSVVRNIWGTDEVPEWGTPPIQPEQLRLMTYMALMGGCRGVTFLGDADLTRPAGESLLIEMGFLNAEIDLFEGILAGTTRRPGYYEVFDPDPPDKPYIPNVNQKRMPLVKEINGKPGLSAAAIPLPGSRGFLMMVADFNGEAQWQPPQLAYHDLLIYARLPRTVQFLEVSPGGARFLEPKVDDVDARGTRITIPDLGVTTMILCTTDLELCRRIQKNVASIRPLAAQWAVRQAEIELARAREGLDRLQTGGHQIVSKEDLKTRSERGITKPPPDAQDLLDAAETFLKNARAAIEEMDYTTAWIEAHHATRPVRTMMYGYWAQGMAEYRKAVEESINGKEIKYPDDAIHPYPKPPILLLANSCPPAISFATLPQLHLWKDWITGLPGYRFGPNRIPSGSFDDPEALTAGGWTDVSHEYPGLEKKDRLRLRPREAAPREKRSKDLKNGAKRYRKNEIRYADEEVAEGDQVLRMTVKATDKETLNQQDPYLDEPASAVLSPPVKVAANNLIRISVLIRQPYPTPGGRGGVIVRDTIGGEAFQFRSPGPIPTYTRVVLYRKAPADGAVRVLLGFAGFGEADFDDLRVEVIEDEGVEAVPVDPGLVEGGRRRNSLPQPPDPREPPAAAARPTSRRER